MISGLLGHHLDQPPRKGLLCCHAGPEQTEGGVGLWCKWPPNSRTVLKTSTLMFSDHTDKRKRIRVQHTEGDGTESNTQK